MEIRWTSCLNLASFCLAILLLVIAGSGASAQHPMGAANKTSICSPGGPCPLGMLSMENSSNDETAYIDIQSWRGFAIKGAKSHPIRVNVESIRPVDPAEARRLLESNTSLEELRSSLMAEDKVPIRAGNMKIDNDIYRLINITVTPSINASTLDANVAGPIAGPRSRSASNKSDIRVGHTTINISSTEGMGSGEGTLVMNDPEYSGTYSLLLEHQFPGHGPRAGLGWA